LIVRGDTPGSDESAPQGVGRDWLTQRLAAAGAQVDLVVAYQRGAPHWDAQQSALASAAAQDGSVWVLSSAEALANLRGLLPVQNWAAARAVATHARIADAARQLGFGQVAVASPTLPSVLASLESLS
jgi:uroporphyrinogen-III synthase